MFERFTREARDAVVGAQHEARTLRHDRIGTEHLLLALLAQPATASAQVLARHGVLREAVVARVRAAHGDVLDAEALTAVGIDLDAVRSSVEQAFGPGALDQPGKARAGHLPFTPRAKKALELSLREALALKSRSIGDVHVLLGLLREREGLAARVLQDHGVDLAALRDELTLALSS